MKMKSYFAPTVEAAIEQARAEMGPEALLVNSRKSPPEAKALGEYEVVCAVVPDGGERHSAVSGSVPAAGPAAEDPVAHELARLRKQMEEMKKLVSTHAPSWSVPAPEFAEISSRLIENDFSTELTQSILKGAHARLEADPAWWSRRRMAFDTEAVERAVRAELEAAVSVDTSLTHAGESPRAIALVGPPGCGKTTTVVKLAIRYGLNLSRPVHLISTDTRRISAAEQLRTYAAIIGAGFDAVEINRGLQQVIETRRETGLILIDTPGFSATEMEEASDLARFLGRDSGIAVHMVAPASMRAADLKGTIDRFEVFSPGRLIFTRLDETSCFGSLVSESVRTEKPISFLASGPQIPEDLELPSADRLLANVFTSSQERALSAA